MSTVTLVGVDPGIIDTGAVAIHLKANTFDTYFERLPGNDADAVVEFVALRRLEGDRLYTFVEAYRDRGTVFSTHGDMRKLEHELKASIPSAKFLENMGVKKVITDDLMRLLELWTFNVPTHHQDLRSAARIALLGAVKDQELNQLLTSVVIGRLKRGNPRNAFNH